MTLNLSEAKNHGCRPHPRGSVRRASGFVLTSQPETDPLQLFWGSSKQKANMLAMIHMDEGRKRVLAIVAGILVARHLKNPEDLHESRPSPRTESLIASAVQWAERIMRRIDGLGR